MEYRYGSHTVYKIEYHFVFVPKYCYKGLKGKVGLKVRELTEEMIKHYLEHHFEPKGDDNFRTET